jgi:hypothetical protein
MSYHEFGIMQISPQHGKRYDEYEPHKYDCISVNDDYIENILEKLRDIDCYWHTFDVSGKGLAYSGITLIPTSSMQKFISVIENIPELQDLKSLLSNAHKENKWIIHFGI